ncbi:unnamed protein product [Spodoptera littoralis]|uniref:N-acetyltransferase domain-containing protein n=1 Tax=Spodoptera littoralis TaxID=7109 RepID=A0A9P0I252_SPOLI|nr:unnamed protein product [Spodoptera littoralis]CAH1638787.1 unnamed protein product [Spodoptera littoralis]
MEWLITEDGKYRIESLSAATFPGALRVITESFCQDESVSIGTEVNKNPVAAEELLELCADAALDGVSLVATSDSSEKPFFEIFAEERCTQPSSRALIEWMAEVDGKCNFFEKYNVDCSLEIMFLATLREHRHQKLGRILCSTSIDLAKRLKNGPVSQISVQDLGPKYSNMAARKPINKVPKICQALWTSEPTQKIGKIIREDFFQDEDVSVGAGINEDPEAAEELLELCADAMLDGLSLVAVEIASGKVVSVVFNKLQEAPSASSGKTFFETFAEERCKRPAAISLIDFMVELDAKCNYFERYGVDCLCELMFLGTLREHRRKGLAKILCKTSVEQAKKLKDRPATPLKIEDLGPKYGIDCLFELLFLGTSREHRQKGLAKLLCKTSIELAKKLKDGPIAPLKVEDLGSKYAFMKPRKPITRAPKLLTAMWTADGTKKIGKDLGFDVLVTVSLKDYIFEGKRYSDGVGFVTTCEGAALKI